MKNEERVLKALKHLKEGLSHLDLLTDEADFSDEYNKDVLETAKEQLSEQVGQLEVLGGRFAQKGC